MSKYVSKQQLLSEETPKKPEEILDIVVRNKSNCKKPSLVNASTYKNGVCWCSSDRQQGRNEIQEIILMVLPSVCAVFTWWSPTQKQDNQASAILTPCKKEGHCFY